MEPIWSLKREAAQAELDVASKELLRRGEDVAAQEQRLAAAASEAREHKLARKTAEDKFATAVEQLEEAQASC